MAVSRRLAALLVTASVALVPAAPALGQKSAGNDQYTDPLDGVTPPPPSQTSTGSTPPPAPSTTTSSDAGTVAPAPSTGGGSDPGSGAAGAGATGEVDELARTGSDVWLVALAGAVLLLTGIGLRARTADDGD